jgi:hypothetical protein
VNARLIGGHAFVAGLFVTTWEVAIAMPAGPASLPLVVAGLVAPPALAGVSLVLIASGQGSRPGPTPEQPVPAPRRAVTRPARKELAR